MMVYSYVIVPGYFNRRKEVNMVIAVVLAVVGVVGLLFMDILMGVLNER